MKRTKLENAVLLFSALIAIAFTYKTNAAPILYEFGGEIDFFSANDGLENPFQAEQTFSGTFTYDRSLIASSDDGVQAVYHETIGNFEMEFGGFHMTGGAETSYIRVGNDTLGGWDFINISTPQLASPQLDYLFKDLSGQFQLQSSASVWDSTDLPTSLNLLEQMPDARFWIYGYYDTPQFQASAVGGGIQYLRTVSVPEPNIILGFYILVCVCSLRMVCSASTKNY